MYANYRFSAKPLQMLSWVKTNNQSSLFLHRVPLFILALVGCIGFHSLLSQFSVYIASSPRGRNTLSLAPTARTVCSCLTLEFFRIRHICKSSRIGTYRRRIDQYFCFSKFDCVVPIITQFHTQWTNYAFINAKLLQLHYINKL